MKRTDRMPFQLFIIYFPDRPSGCSSGSGVQSAVPSGPHFCFFTDELIVQSKIMTNAQQSFRSGVQIT